MANLKPNGCSSNLFSFKMFRHFDDIMSSSLDKKKFVLVFLYNNYKDNKHKIINNVSKYQFMSTFCSGRISKLSISIYFNFTYQVFVFYYMLEGMDT